jgi:hypothetical protein
MEVYFIYAAKNRTRSNLTNSVEHSRTWEVASHYLAVQEICRLLWKSEARFHIYKILLPNPKLGHFNLVHILMCKIYINIICLSTPVGLPNRPFFSGFLTKILSLLVPFFLTHAEYSYYPSNPSLFDHE